MTTEPGPTPTYIAGLDALIRLCRAMENSPMPEIAASPAALLQGAADRRWSDRQSYETLAAALVNAAPAILAEMEESDGELKRLRQENSWMYDRLDLGDQEDFQRITAGEDEDSA